MITDVRIDLTTDASGDATATASSKYIGRLLAVECVLSGLDATADITLAITGSPGGVDRTIETITNSNTNVFADIVADALGNNGAASGTDVNPLVVGSPKVTIAQGGNVTSATIIFYIDDLRS